jgi:hypothetical protein
VININSVISIFKYLPIIHSISLILITSASMIAAVGIIKIAMDQARKIVLFSIASNFKIRDLKCKSVIGKIILFSQLHKNNWEK